MILLAVTNCHEGGISMEIIGVKNITGSDYKYVRYEDCIAVGPLSEQHTSIAYKVSDRDPISAGIFLMHEGKVKIPDGSESTSMGLSSQEDDEQIIQAAIEASCDN
jgi:hypothetical protein